MPRHHMLIPREIVKTCIVCIEEVNSTISYINCLKMYDGKSLREYDLSIEALSGLIGQLTDLADEYKDTM